MVPFTFMVHLSCTHEGGEGARSRWRTAVRCWHSGEEPRRSGGGRSVCALVTCVFMIERPLFCTLVLPVHPSRWAQLLELPALLAPPSGPQPRDKSLAVIDQPSVAYRPHRQSLCTGNIPSYRPQRAPPTRPAALCPRSTRPCVPFSRSVWICLCKCLSSVFFRLFSACHHVVRGTGSAACLG